MVWPVAATGATVDGIVTPDAEQPDTAMYNVVTPSLVSSNAVIASVGESPRRQLQETAAVF